MGGIKTHIVSQNGNPLVITEDGGINVSLIPHPPLNEVHSVLPYREYFKNGASTDMRVNGATTNVSFIVPADPNYTYYVSSLNVKIADAAAKLDKFGALTALTNGIEFTWFTQETGSLVIHEGLKTNLMFFRMSSQVPQIIDLSGGGADAIIVTIDLASLFKNQWGLRLRKGTTDKLVFKVKDDLSTGLDEFNIIGYGIKL